MRQKTLKKTRQRIFSILASIALVTCSISIPENAKPANAAGVKKTGYTLSKKAGTYQKAVKVQIKSKKGYKVYYTLNGSFRIKMVVKSGKKKTLTIKKTKTLSIYCVKSDKKITTAFLKKKSVIKKAQTYRYVIKKTAENSDTAHTDVSATSAPAVTSVPAAISTPLASAAPESTDSSGSIDPDGTAQAAQIEVTSSTSQTIDLSTTNGLKVSEADTGYTYKKNKKNKIQIMAPGTYTINGNGSTVDAQIVVDFGEKYDSDGDGTDDTSYETSQSPAADAVHIIFNNITLTDTNKDFHINQTAKMTSDDGLVKVKSSNYLTGVRLTVENTVNLIDTGVTGINSEDATDTTYPAGILSKKTPLEIDGSGTLQISSANGNGIKSTSSLLIQNAKVLVGTSETFVGHNGITAKSAIETQNADIAVYSATDGIKTTYGSTDVTNANNPFEPSLKLNGGNITIQTKNGDGLSVSYTIGDNTTSEASYGTAEIAPETLNIITSSASGNVPDDAIHGNGNVNITGGTLKITSSDDGIHADSTLTIGGGTIDVQASYEGLEGNDVMISDGTISVTAKDDGINISGGSDSKNSAQDSFKPIQNSSGTSAGSTGSYKGLKAGSSLIIRSGVITIDTSSLGAKNDSQDGGMINTADASHSITISGGILKIDAEGDGIDSNGNLYINGGTITINGPSESGNSFIDIGDGNDCVFEINGGVLWAFAGTSDMVAAPTKTESGYLIFALDSAIPAGQAVTIKNSSGDVSQAVTSKNTASVMYYDSSILSGENYSLYAGDSLASTITAAGS